MPKTRRAYRPALRRARALGIEDLRRSCFEEGTHDKHLAGVSVSLRGDDLCLAQFEL